MSTLRKQVDSAPLSEVTRQLLEQKNSEMDDLHAHIAELQDSSEVQTLVS